MSQDSMNPGRHFILKGGLPLISGEPGQPLAVLVVGPGNEEAWDIVSADNINTGNVKMWFAKSEKGVYLGKERDSDQLIGVANQSEALAFQAIPIKTYEEATYLVIANELAMTNVPPTDARPGLSGFAWAKPLNESDAAQVWSIPLRLLEGKETQYGA